MDTLSRGASLHHATIGASPDEAFIERIAGGWLPPLFAAIDFETASLCSTSACAVAVVRVKEGELEQTSGLGEKRWGNTCCSDMTTEDRTLTWSLRQ